MDIKKQLLELIISELKRQHETLFESAKEAKNAATNEESKAENKYDTRGLEASYLAGAQAKRTTELEATIKLMLDWSESVLSKKNQVSTGSLIKVELNGEQNLNYFLLPKVGGISLEIKNEKFTTISPESPLGEHLLGLKEGGFFEFTSKGDTKEYEVVEIY